MWGDRSWVWVSVRGDSIYVPQTLYVLQGFRSTYKGERRHCVTMLASPKFVVFTKENVKTSGLRVLRRVPWFKITLTVGTLRCTHSENFFSSLPRSVDFVRKSVVVHFGTPYKGSLRRSLSVSVRTLTSFGFCKGRPVLVRTRTRRMRKRMELRPSQTFLVSFLLFRSVRRQKVHVARGRPATVL